MLNPLVSITIATYNSELWIEKCLESLFCQTYPRESVEIIVVDDGSADSTREKVGKIAFSHPNVKLVSQPNKGTAAAHTECLKQASGKYIFMISHDAYAEPNWVESVVEVFERNPQVSIVQGQVVPVREVTEPFAHVVEFTSFNRSFATVAIAYRTKDLDLVGRYFLEELSRYGDDAELAYRLLKQGTNSVFLEQVTARHEIVPQEFWTEIKNAWGRYRFCLLFKIHPQARSFLHQGFLWGSKERYLRTLFFPLLIPAAGVAYVYNKSLGQKWLHQILEELVFFGALCWGSIKYRSLVL